MLPVDRSGVEVEGVHLGLPVMYGGEVGPSRPTFHASSRQGRCGGRPTCLARRRQGRRGREGGWDNLSLPVMLPVDWTGVEGERGEVCLADQGAGKVSRNVPVLREEDGVPTQLGHNVLSAHKETICS